MSNATTAIQWDVALADLLNELSTVQDELLDTLTQKREQMVASDLPGMEQMQAREQKLVVRLEACQQRRAELLEQANQEGLQAENLAQLADALPDDKEGKLGKQVKDASLRTRLLQQHGLTNWVVAQRTLLHLSQMLEIIATGGRLQPTYQQGTAVACGAIVDHAV